MRLMLVFTLWTGGPPAPGGGDPWFGRDKLLHVTASALIQGGAHAALRSRGAPYGQASWGAAAVTVSAAIGKELWDRHRRRDFSLKDLAWDGLGGTAGAVAVRQVDRR